MARRGMSSNSHVSGACASTQPPASRTFAMPAEPLELFPDLRLLAYREEGVFGDPAEGLRNEAWLVAARPPV